MSESAGDVHPRKVGYLQLTFLIYGAACGGAFGLESMVGSAGPGIAILILVVLPFLFSVPLSLAVSELTTTFPVEGGNYRWSRMAFGNFWGFQSGWWAWASSVVTCASFVTLFTQYVLTWLPVDPHAVASNQPQWYWTRYLIGLVLIWGVHWLNVRGIDVVGNAAVAMSFLLLMPFVAMVVVGVAHWHVSPLQPFIAPDKGIADLGAAVATAIWLYSGYEKLSSAAEEVDNPQKIFPPALFTAAILAMLSYVLPTLFALAELGNWADWTDGYFATVAGQMCGEGMKQAMIVGGLISNALLLNVTMLSASRTLYSMGEDRLMPHVLHRTNARFGTPTLALLVGSILMSLLSALTFTQLVLIYAWLQMSANIMIYVNAWAMRRTHPDTPRPFKVPFGAWGLAAITLPMVLLALYSMVCNVFTNWQFNAAGCAVAAASLLSGFVVYPILATRNATNPSLDQ